MHRSAAPLVGLALLALAMTPDPATAGWDEGIAAFKAKDFQTAVAEFEEVVEQNPESYQGRYMLGLSFQQLKGHAQALGHLEKAYELNPDDPSLKLALARAYFALGHYPSASETLGTVDASTLPDAQRAGVLQMRAQARLKSGDETEALDDLEQLAGLKPSDVAVRRSLGSWALKVGQTDRAIGALGEASKLDPGSSDVKRALATALTRKGRESRDKAAKTEAYLKAAAVAGELVALEASHANLMIKLPAELGAGLYVEAIETGKAAAATKGDDWLSHYYLGQAYSSNRQFREAEAPLEKASELASGFSDLALVWKQIGYVLEKQKKYTESIVAYEKAGDKAGVARCTENIETLEENRRIAVENRRIEEMAAEAAKLEAELKALEEGVDP